MTRLRDFAIILISAELFVLALLPLVLLGGLVYGVWWLRRPRHLPSWLKIAQAYLGMGQAYVELAMAAAVKPILLASAMSARVQRWLGAGTTSQRGGNER
jgi:hypothetical protein